MKLYDYGCGRITKVFKSNIRGYIRWQKNQTML